MSIHDVPDEILIHIFSYIDSCRSLHRCCQVSQRFHNIATIFKTKSNFWKQCCLSELPEDVLLDLSGKGSMTNLIFRGHGEAKLEQDTSHNDSESKWEEMFRIHQRTWLLGNSHCKEMKREIETNRPVSSLRINGDYVVVGCYHGTLSVWDHLTGDLIIDTYANYRGVTNLELIDDEGFDLPFSEKEGLQTRLLVTGGVDRYVIVHVLDMTSCGCDVFWKYECADRILQIRVFGQTMVVSAMDSFLAGIRVLDSRRRVLLYHLYGHQSSPTAVSIWDNQVWCGSLKGDLLVWNIQKPEVIDDEPRTEIDIIEKAEIVDFDNSYRFIDMVTRDKLILCLTGDRDLHVSYDGKFTRHYMFNRLSACPQIVRMRGNIVALGTSAGTCALYRVSSLPNISEEFVNPPLETVHTTSENVRDLDISDDGDGPMVAMATEGPTITVVRWYS